MKNFRRAIRDSLHHWPTICLATLCSIGVATLWGANIGALLPVIEMTLRKESMQTWLETRIEESEVSLRQLTTQVAAMDDPTTATVNPDREVSEVADTKQIRDQITSESSKIAWNRWLLGWVNTLLPRDPFRTICAIMGILMISTVVKQVMMLCNELLIGHVSTSIVRSLRMRLFKRVLAFDRGTYQEYGTSGVLANVTHASDSLSNGLINFFGAAVREPLRIVSCLIGASLICWRLLLLSMILAPLMVWCVTYFNRKVRSVAQTILGRNVGFHEVILEALNNIVTVQAYSMEKAEIEGFDRCTRDMQKCSKQMIFFGGLSRPFTELIGVGMIAITICAGVYLVVNQQTHIFFLKICDEPLSISSMLVFFGMLVGASDPLRKLSGVFTSIYTGALAADSIYGLLDREIILTESKQPIAIPHPHKSLRIQNASFSYDASRPVLKDVSLEIPFGRSIAILGENGSGKSTLIQLLGRYYDPVTGSVSMDGIDYKDASIQDIRKRIALVSQTTELFNRTVLANIQYGSPGSTREEAIAAAKLAHADEFITGKLSNGYETVVGHQGQRLSGGQRQRIALARAILRKPEILILDESTSQIDMASEEQIRDTLSTMKGKFTTIIITHREALIAIVDEVYEVNQGTLRLVESKRKAAA